MYPYIDLAKVNEEASAPNIMSYDSNYFVPDR